LPSAATEDCPKTGCSPYTGLADGPTRIIARASAGLAWQRQMRRAGRVHRGSGRGVLVRGIVRGDQRPDDGREHEDAEQDDAYLGLGRHPAHQPGWAASWVTAVSSVLMARATVIAWPPRLGPGDRSNTMTRSTIRLASRTAKVITRKIHHAGPARAAATALAVAATAVNSPAGQVGYCIVAIMKVLVTFPTWLTIMDFRPA
jgi:hypothetical protein